jgi:hypothetical protein
MGGVYRGLGEGRSRRNWGWGGGGLGESEGAGVESWNDCAGRGLEFRRLLTCDEAAELLEAQYVCCLRS